MLKRTVYKGSIIVLETFAFSPTGIYLNVFEIGYIYYRLVKPNGSYG